MPPEPLGLGIDLGSSGLRLALADRRGARIAEIACQYPSPFNDPLGWRQGLIALAAQLTGEQRKQVGAIAIDGTSGTLLLCRPDGSLAPGPLGQALPFHQACPEQGEEAATIACSGPAASSSGSLARALALLAAAERAGESGPWLLRHQADWLMGWLLNCWRWGEEGNNLRLGWDLQRQCWQGAIGQQSWAGGLPEIIDSGRIVGSLAHGAAAALGLAEGCQVVAGSTDANAGVLAANPAMGDGISVLGTTLVLKQWAPQPISAPGVSSHRLGGRWLAGGAANAGAGVLRQFFNDAQLAELSRQIDPRQASGLDLRPLPGRGERFPIDDPELEPVLGPRPVSDARFLQGLLEGLARHEAAGWARLQELGAPPVRRVISLGGGARNPQWRSIRERLLGVPVLNRPKLSAALGMARLAAAALPHP